MSSTNGNSGKGYPDKQDFTQARWRLGALLALAVFTGEMDDVDPEPETDYSTVHSFAYLVYWLRHQVRRVKSALGLSAQRSGRATAPEDLP
ncbi:MAG TPA: hypothetical protein VF502_06645 [Stellaceae bacterium]